MTHHAGGGGARSLILGRIRDVIRTTGPTGPAGAPETTNVPAETAAAAHRLIPREYRTTAGLDAGACLELLTSRLEHYQVDVYRAEPATLAKTIADALTARGKTGLVVPADIDPSWLPPGFEFVPDVDLSFDVLDRCQGALTGCSAAIANTGTIVLSHGAGEGRRVLTLIPDYHLCVVQASQVVQTVPEALRGAARNRPRLLTTISGPSATADIEMTRIRGVHGPRTLDVVLVV